jgi:hypothetical protein
MLIWVVAGAASAHGTPTDCGTLDVKTCNEASDAGTAIGVGILIALWAFGDLILGVLWLITNRGKSRDCPVCGRGVKKGAVVCKSCGYDFRAPMAQAQARGQQGPSGYAAAPPPTWMQPAMPPPPTQPPYQE